MHPVQAHVLEQDLARLQRLLAPRALPRLLLGRAQRHDRHLSSVLFWRATPRLVAGRRQRGRDGLRQAALGSALLEQPVRPVALRQMRERLSSSTPGQSHSEARICNITMRPMALFAVHSAGHACGTTSLEAPSHAATRVL